MARPRSAAELADLFNIDVYFGGALALYALQQEIGPVAFQRLEREQALDRPASAAVLAGYGDIVSAAVLAVLQRFVDHGDLNFRSALTS